MLKDLLGIEIFSAGIWNGDEYTVTDLDAMVEANAIIGDRLNAPLKLGHDDAQKFLQDSGLPSFGWVENLRRDGEKLLADIRGIPQKIFELIQNGAYRKRSAEILWDWDDKESGRTFSRVLCGLALLGAELPAVSTLDDILALYGGQASPHLHAYLGDMDVRSATSNNEFMALAESKLSDHKDYNQLLEKMTVNFVREGGDSSEACGICRFYQPDFISCAIVEGIVRPEDVCDLYEPREAIQDRLFTLDDQTSNDEEVNVVKDDDKKTYSAEEVEALIKEQMKSTLEAQKIEADKQREEDRKKYDEERAEDRKRHEEERAEDKKLYDTLRDEGNMDKIVSFVDSLSAKDNMRISPANKDRAIYLLAECGKAEPKVYGVKDKDGKEANRSYEETLKDFMKSQEDLSKLGLFDTITHDEKTWKGLPSESTTEGKLLKLVKEYREHNPEVKELSDLDVMEIVSKENDVNGDLFEKYINSGGNA